MEENKKMFRLLDKFINFERTLLTFADNFYFQSNFVFTINLCCNMKINEIELFRFQWNCSLISFSIIFKLFQSFQFKASKNLNFLEIFSFHKIKTLVEKYNFEELRAPARRDIALLHKRSEDLIKIRQHRN